MVKKLKPTDAIEMLPHSGKKAGLIILKAMKTSVANAVAKGADTDELTLKEIQVNEGPRLKRFRAGSRGAAQPYIRRMSHLRVVLATRKSEIPNSKSEVKHKNIESKTKMARTRKEIKK